MSQFNRVRAANVRSQEQMINFIELMQSEYWRNGREMLSEGFLPFSTGTATNGLMGRNKKHTKKRRRRRKVVMWLVFKETPGLTAQLLLSCAGLQETCWV